MVSAFVCPADPSVTDGIIVGGTYGGTSYAANAQVFAPLTDESINGGFMYQATHPDFTDRAQSIARIKDGISNTVIFIHTYALCGSTTQGAAWGYGSGIGQAPSTTPSFQPWLRASYLGQTYMTTGAAIPESTDSLQHRRLQMG